MRPVPRRPVWPRNSSAHAIRFLGQPLPSLLLLLWLAELVVAAAAPGLARLILGAAASTDDTTAIASVFAALTVLAMLTLGLFSPRQRDRTVALMLRVSVAVVAAAVVTRIVCELAAVRVSTPRLLSVTTLLAWGGLVALTVAARPVLDRDVLRRRVLVFGAGRRAAHIARLRRRADRRGFKLVGYVPGEGESLLIPTEQVLEPRMPLRDYCFAHEIDEIVVAMDDRRRSASRCTSSSSAAWPASTSSSCRASSSARPARSASTC